MAVIDREMTDWEQAGMEWWNRTDLESRNTMLNSPLVVAESHCSGTPERSAARCYAVFIGCDR